MSDWVDDLHVLLGVLVVLQLTLFRASQVIRPTLCFRTADLVESRGDVAPGAVLWRLMIPAIAGGVAYLIDPDAKIAAIAAGATAWFLIIWPVLWLPRVTRHPYQPTVLVLLAVFWVAYALMPLSGYAIGAAIHAAVTDAAFDRHSFFLNAVIFPVLNYPILLTLGAVHGEALGRREDREIQIALNEFETPGDVPDSLWRDYADEWAGLLPLAIIPAAASALAAILVRRLVR